MSKDTSFKGKLGDEELKFFNGIVCKPFSEQATAFLNAYWPEVGSQADHIFMVGWEFFKSTDMLFKGVEYVHLYDEGVNLDFDAGLKFFESICKYWDDEKNEFVSDDAFAPSKPVMMTAIKRKKELRDKVDVNFDGRVSFMEYLLYQYQDLDGVDPASFIKKAMAVGTDEPPEVVAAREALANVMAQIKKYEAKKQKLTDQSKLPGVKGLKAKNQLAQLDSSPLMEELNVLLITAEAAVRKVIKKYGGKTYVQNDDGSKKYDASQQAGSRYWLNKDLAAKKAKYGKKKK